LKKHSDHNPELKLAFDFVEFTDRNIFLTGRAGTGKTTFLHNLKVKSPKRMIVVAPTGVAAINAGGVTIHSFFQLPFGPIVPGYADTNAKSAMRFSKQKRSIIKSLDLLVIDEISMVRADLLDGIDQVLRRFRRNDEPFGGVQILMIGDMQQLPPVVKDEEWRLLRQHYKTAYFFSSLALQKTDYITVTLQHVYRQKDQAFVEVLNKIRDKKVDDQAIEILNARYNPDFDHAAENYIILTTHNAKAKITNDNKLAELKAKKGKYKAKIKGNFPEYIYPTEPELELKIGAQVMFVKNDPEPEKRFFNGKIGVITKIGKEELVVKCPDDKEDIFVDPIEWQNIKYSIDEESKEIQETVEGSFTQIPLKLAWAITIHKSQGLTFDRVIIDSEAAFAHGQVYVAFSRCRSLEGLVLSTPFSPLNIKENSSIDGFNRLVESNQPDDKVLEKSKMGFQQKLLLSVFTFTNIENEVKWFTRLLFKHKRSLPGDAPGRVSEIKDVLKKSVISVSEGFRKQINTLLVKNANAEDNEELQERIKKASIYFRDKINDDLKSKIEEISFETDNQEVRKQIKKSLTGLHDEMTLVLQCLKSCENGFNVKHYLNDRAKALVGELSKTSAAKNRKLPVSKDIVNLKLYNVLKAWRDKKAAEEGFPFYMVLTVKTMRALSNQVPQTMEELKRVHGFGKRKMESYGEEMLQMLKDFANENEVKVVIPEEAVERKPKTDTKKQSLDLWFKYKDVKKIADERDFATSTIHGHLAHFVGRGELKATDFVAEEKLKKITETLLKNPEMSLGETKESLGDDYSYPELKYARQHLVWLEKQKGDKP
jgi:hypothetical protein